jgi:hypothetical protein
MRGSAAMTKEPKTSEPDASYLALLEARCPFADAIRRLVRAEIAAERERAEPKDGDFDGLCSNCGQTAEAHVSVCGWNGGAVHLVCPRAIQER